MPITIEHGNIAAALGLASAAGQAQRMKTISDQDLQFLGLVNNAQSEADRNYANQIGLALQGSENQAHNSLAANQQGIEQQHYGAQRAQADRQFGFEQQQLAATQANRSLQADARSRGLDIRQQSADTRDDAQGLRETEYQTKQDAIGQLDPSIAPMVQATGRAPWQPSGLNIDPAAKAASDESKLVSQQMKQAADAMKAASYSADPKDMLGPKGKPSSAVPGAALGMEQQYSQAAAAMSALQARQKELNARIQRSSDAMAADPTATLRRNQAAYNQSFNAQNVDGTAPPAVQRRNHPAYNANPTPQGAAKPSAGDVFAPVSSSPAPAGGGPGGVPVIRSRADFDALPPGSDYTNPNRPGIVFTKH